MARSATRVVPSVAPNLQFPLNPPPGSVEPLGPSTRQAANALPFLTVDDVATWLLCSTKSIRRRVHDHRLPAVRGPGGRLLFDRHAVMAALRPASDDGANVPADCPVQIPNLSLAAMASDLTTLNA